MRIKLASLSRDWSVIASLFLVDALLLLTSDFRLVWRSECGILVSAFILTSIAQFYSRFRHAPRLANMAETGCLLILFTNAAVVFNYIMAGILPLPLWDASFDVADKAFGLDWMSLFRWVAAHPAIYTGSNIVYFALAPELIFLLLLLEGLGRRGQATELRRCFVASALITIFFGILMPAAGPFVFYHLPIAQTTAYVAQEAALRNGALRLIDLANAEGLVAFPSFHAALAILCAYAARSLKYLTVPVLLLNILIVISSPVIGGHYYVDIFAGLILAAAVIAVERRLTSRDAAESTRSFASLPFRRSARV